VFSKLFFPLKIVPFMRKRGKTLKSRAGHRWKYGACTLHTGYLRLHMHILRLCNTHCFSTATMVARRRLNVTLYVHCLSCLIPYLNYIFILRIPDEMLTVTTFNFFLASTPKPAFPKLLTRRFLRSQNETSCTPFQWPLNWNFKLQNFLILYTASFCNRNVAKCM